MQPEVNLPSPPTALARIIEAAGNPNFGMGRLGKLVERDPNFAAAVIRVANSARYRGRSVVTTPGEACRRLGIRALRNLALVLAARSCVTPRKLGGFDLDAYWERSLRRAVSGEVLFELDGMDPGLGFTIGLLQDLSVLVLVLEQPEQAQQYSSGIATNPEQQRELEQQLFGRTHEDSARELIKHWVLPDDLALPILYHHDAKRAPERASRSAELANLADHMALVLDSGDPEMLREMQDTLERVFGIDTERVDSLIDSVGTRVRDWAHELGFTVGRQPSVEEILRAANQSLVDMNLSYEQLVRKLEQTLAEKQALTNKLEKANEELERLIVTDPLTGLNNRRVLSERLRAEISTVVRHGGEFTVLVGDVDRFKRVNDRWGHGFGDRVLVHVSERLHGAVRPSDVVVRAGGEEFAVLLRRTSEKGGQTLAERILEQLRSEAIEAPDEEQIRVTMSIGVCTIRGPAAARVNLDDLCTSIYTRADHAMYQSKQQGRDRVSVAPAIDLRQGLRAVRG